MANQRVKLGSRCGLPIADNSRRCPRPTVKPASVDVNRLARHRHTHHCPTAWGSAVTGSLDPLASPEDRPDAVHRRKRRLCGVCGLCCAGSSAFLLRDCYPSQCVRFTGSTTERMPLMKLFFPPLWRGIGPVCGLSAFCLGRNSVNLNDQVGHRQRVPRCLPARLFLGEAWIERAISSACRPPVGGPPGGPQKGWVCAGLPGDPINHQPGGHGKNEALRYPAAPNSNHCAGGTSSTAGTPGARLPPVMWPCRRI